MPETGQLLVIATPIGNLADLAPRASAALSQAEVIACESVAAARRLYSALQLPLPRTTPFREDSSAATQSSLLQVLSEGKTVGLISDAGTPGISDPGWKLARACHEQGIPVRSLAGPSSLTAALAVAGLPTRRFLFEGFPPHSGSDRREFFKSVAQQPVTTVILESPHRVHEALERLQEYCGGDRLLSISRELTKVHETTELKSLTEWCQNPPLPRGEFVLVLEPAVLAEAEHEDHAPEASYLAECGLNAAQIRHYLIEFCGMPRNAAYKVALQAAKQS